MKKTEQILEAIKEEKTLTEIYEIVSEIKRPTVRCVLNNGVKKGTITRVEKGKYKIAEKEVPQV